MKIINSNKISSKELPLKLIISFEAVFEYLEKIDKNHFLYPSAIQLLEEYKNYPVLREGFEDFNLLDKYNNQIDKLLDILFPDLLQTNEIKAISIPFEFTTFKLSKRFQKILDNAGENYEFKMNNFDESHIYILTCTFILAYCYNIDVDFKRPLFIDIPDKKTGLIKHYRILLNGDFLKIKPLKNAIKITAEDINILRDNFHNIDIWREKFPPNSYEFKGFGIMNLFDVSPDYALSKLRENLLKKDDRSFKELEQSISNLFNSTSIKFGISTYSFNSNQITSKFYNSQYSFIISNDIDSNCDGFFCDGIVQNVFENKELLAISDVDKYGIDSNYNGLYRALKEKGILSFILVPIKLKDDLFGIMELVSENKYELNSINAHKLEDVVPIFKIALQRYMDELHSKLESVIQENYTSLHPTVKWKFYQEAEEYLFNVDTGEKTTENLKDIIFENVVPLYGQSDIRGSSVDRNTSIQQDLGKQLSLASKVMEKASKIYDLPIYSDLLYRIKICKHDIKSELNSGDELNITEFLKRDIYPVFNHLKSINPDLKKDVESYMKNIDQQLHVVYDKRKKYETSVNKLNEELANFLDTKQIEAQKMFPHYFERYKTDGVDYNMYIGQSLVQNHTYNEIYLYNLRLWQLQMMCEMEVIANDLKSKLEHPLEIASLILIHSTPLSIKFRMDEKRFDVDGAYNIRYEIIKKRIDKALIKNSNERLTQPGKIAIVYSQKKDAEEYLKYIKHLQSKKYLLNNVEKLDIEDLQGTTGLKALRVSVNFDNLNENKITMDDIMNVINDKS